MICRPTHYSVCSVTSVVEFLLSRFCGWIARLALDIEEPEVTKVYQILVLNFDHGINRTNGRS